MYLTEQFIQSCLLAIILTALSVKTSVYFYLTIVLCSAVMLLFTARSLRDREKKSAYLIYIPLFTVFALLSGNLWSYLIFYEIRLNKYTQIFLPPAVYLCTELIKSDSRLPSVLLNCIIISALSFFFFISEKITLSYISAKRQIAKSVSITAVNEMYEKKLNKELVIKNYLADKNARLEERENISRNIHNSVGHSITAAMMTLDAADILFDTSPDMAREKMNTARTRIKGSLDSIRHAVRVLDTEAEFISAQDFLAEITAVTDDFTMDTTIKIKSDFDGLPIQISIPREHTEFLTGAVKELLTNGVRHGNADIFTILFSADSSHIKLIMTDNGQSEFSKENAEKKIHDGFGLKKLISYADKSGGYAAFENKNGFRSVIVLPIYTEEKI